MGTFYCQAGNEVTGKMDVPRVEKEARRDVIFIIALMRAKMDEGRVAGRRGRSTARSRAAPPQHRSLLSALF